jgi:phosphopantetheinyl transferase (holo-ACP synthase)
MPEYQRAVLKDDRVAVAMLLARHWTSKEAAYKAFHPRVALRWHDLSLRYQPPTDEHSQGAKPELILTGRYASMNDDYRIHSSLTHDADLMMAFVVVEERLSGNQMSTPEVNIRMMR